MKTFRSVIAAAPNRAATEGSGLLLLLALAIALCLPAFAVETKYWQENDEAAFDKGTLKNVALRSDGRLSLAPEVKEVYDTSVPYLWSIARDSRGNVYAGGGSSGNDNAKVFEISPGGKAKVLASVPGLEIHAVAVNARDEIFAAINPDGKVWLIGHDGKAQVYFDPHARYIWALAFDSHGNLYVATGDEGKVFRVAPGGKGSVFFNSQDTNARSLAIDKDDNVIVGTDPSGLILRVSPSGTGFVLYESARKEVSALAIGSNGTIYAAANGMKQPGAPAAAPPQAAPPPAPSAAMAQLGVKVATPAAPPPAPLGPPTLAGGSEVYRIEPDGSPHRVWTSPQSLVYAIALDANGLPLLGTGNSGRVYRLDNDILSTILLDVPPTQITAFVPGANGVLYAATGNIGKIYRVGPGLSNAGTYESEVLDAVQFSHWGQLSLQGVTQGVAVSTRSGNVNRTQNNWSAWAPVRLEPDPGCESCANGQVTSPAARFIQYRLEITGSGAANEVDLAFLPKNVAPVIQQIEIAPANYRFPAPVAAPPSSPSPASITLPALGTRHPTSAAPIAEPASTAQTLTYSKGIIGVRWAATDENGDTLFYRVEIRGTHQQTWLPLKDKVREKYIDIDSTAFPDGEYELRVTASDAPGNPEGQALTATLVSDPFLIDNTPPVITDLTATRSAIRWHARDAKSNVVRAEFNINGGEWKMAAPVGGLFDQLNADFDVQASTAPGDVVAVRVTDDFDNTTVSSIVCR